MRQLRLWCFFLAALLGLSATSLAQREKLPPEDLALINQRFPEAQKTITGLRYVIHEPGTGEPARVGDKVSVLYMGALIDGKVFNDFRDPKNPFSFRIGRSEVIDGWDQGLKLLREGGRMTLIVPAELGYGSRGQPPLIPRLSTLIFEITLVKIERGAEPPPAPEPPKKKRWYQL